MPLNFRCDMVHWTCINNVINKMHILNFSRLFNFFANISGLIKKATIIMLPVLVVGCKSTSLNNDFTYTASTSPLTDVLEAKERALATNKLLLVVLGAQWCHDSTGLADQFNTEQMQLILGAHYETVFVDVGTLNDKRRITELFDYPIYYATPTVMIVEPSTDTLLNRTSMTMWGHADSISLSAYVEYFSQFPALTKNQRQLIATWSASAEEAQYNREMAGRLQNAYEKLGPLLAEDIKGNTPPSFIDLWKEVKGFRTALQKNLEKRAVLKLESHDKSDASPTPALRHYPPFSWEQH